MAVTEAITRGDDERLVALNMEETGTLCHLMMGVDTFRQAVLAGSARDPVTARWLKLYEKLAAANDSLMGKRP